MGDEIKKCGQTVNFRQKKASNPWRLSIYDNSPFRGLASIALFYISPRDFILGYPPVRQ